MLLSINKQLFLSQNTHVSRPLEASDIPSIARHYKTKHGITIYPNGETAVGRQMIEEKKLQIEAKYNLDIATFEGEKRYVSYAKRGFAYGDFTMHWMRIGKEKDQKIQALLKPYLDKWGDIDSNLTESEYEQINHLIKNEDELKQLFDTEIKKYTDHLRKKAIEDISDCCLSQEEVWVEINSIQETLKDNEAVGYFYTNGVTLSQKHFEVVLITKNSVIKPVSWYGLVNPFRFPEGNKGPSVYLGSSVVFQSKHSIPIAQSDTTACGSLGFMYLKELLKNNAQQLKEYTLSFQFYDDKGKLVWFFFPSPHVLRYSQSSVYNYLMVSLLEDRVEKCTIKNKDKEYQLATLKGLLEHSVKIAEEQGHHALKATNLNLLKNLNEFRQKWISAYHNVSQNRQSMQDEKRGFNRYLTYVTHRLAKYSTSQLANEPELNVHKNNKLPDEVATAPLNDASLVLPKKVQRVDKLSSPMHSNPAQTQENNEDNRKRKSPIRRNMSHKQSSNASSIIQLNPMYFSNKSTQDNAATDKKSQQNHS